MFIMAALALVICLALFGLMVWSLNIVSKTATNSLNNVKTQLDDSGETMSKSLQGNVETVAKDTSSTVTELSVSSMENLASGVVGQLKSQFELALDTARTVAHAVEGYKAGVQNDQLKRDDILRILQGIMKAHEKDFLAVWIGFEPNAFDGKDVDFQNKNEFGCDATGRFMPWVYMENGKLFIVPLEDADTSDFYNGAKKSGQEYITDPYEYDGSMILSTTVPIIFDGKTIGVVGVDLTYEILDAALRTHTPYETGYVYMVSGTGYFVWHPNRKLVVDKTRLDKLDGRDSIAKSIRDGKPLTVILPDLTTKKDIYQVMEPIHFGNCPNPWGVVISAEYDKVMERFTHIQQLLEELSSNSETQISTMLSDIEKTDKEANESLAGDSRRAQSIAVGAVAVIFIVSVIIAVFIGRSFAAPLIQGVSILQSVAENGDLNVELPNTITRRKDEFGDIGNGINSVLKEFRQVADHAKEWAVGNWTTQVKIRGDADVMNKDLASMVEQVRHALTEIAEGVRQVNTGAGEVSSASQTLSSGAQESAASLEQITASMSEISSQTKTNAQSATEARDLAQKATQAATKGQEAMQEMTGAMDRITSNSTEIQRVIKVIDDIAFQTNLLALNAAVEAARAGVHGKGFAVVAEEVRNLAARSAKAAQETTELISKSGQEIDNGGAVASRTAEILNSIVDQIKQTTDLVAGIAVASNEQAQGVAQVTVGLQQIDSVTQQNTAAAEESASAAGEMNGMASNLQQLVAKFKLRS